MTSQELATEIKGMDEEKEYSKKETEFQHIFDIYDISEVKISDPGLKGIINLDYKLVLKSHGRIRERFGKVHVNIVERLINTLGVPGHRGKKHKIITSWASGKYNKNTKTVLETFKIIEGRTKENPIQIFVKAVENASPRDEVTTIQYGGARYPQAVDCSPIRRVNIAIRNIVHGAYDKSFNKKKTIAETLADEIIATANKANESFSYTKKNDMEKQADGAR